MSANSKEHLSSQKARLVSPIVNITGGQPKCFQFYYLMHGAWVGTLNVYLSPNGTASVPVWSRSGTQGINYKLGQVTVNKTAMVSLASVAPSGSVQAIACDFELEDICGYSNVPSDSLDWHRSFGTVSGGKREFDHTTGTAQ
ncbi:unnamed protein product, partial [Candidula unifasciata]